MGLKLNRAVIGLSSLIAGTALPGLALAAQPEHWQLNMQPAVTPVAEQMHSFHDLLLWIIITISVFVAGLLVYVMFKFRSGANPNPSKTAHNTLIEVLWTVAPIMILVVIAIPSFRLLYVSDKAADAEMTVKVQGYQWYWAYSYPDEGEFVVESRIAARTEAEATDGKIRLLSTDNPLVVPVDTTIRVILTSDNVIHSWAVPAFGVQKYTTPGHANETWFKAEQTGTFYGMCQQICGADHGFMPVEVKVVSKEEYAAWIAAQKAQAGLTPATTSVAEAAAAPAAQN
ncbi:cytochrome c oxidase subunit II [Zavarzinia compransoris]|uniref:Cytochrome c oxidase subunit 2 n=1 Tax=Zavarzinia compransoris TaxID=1264899 RepID=A0A317E388_9PROT|nr:cytochrome c oxidase subunit II [Zavarzinia compransoris]PWR19853.1 cytochrome c oxidase subunit II [Zavarzinia compransoris]TDP45037.1 cytochrome c oxidase subunit 2 [Zavarzinia compransoris]